MANLIKPNKVGGGTGLHARMSAASILKESVGIPTDINQFPNRLVIMADLSGSMDEPASGRWDSNSPHKLQYLKDAIQDFSLRSNELDTAIAVQSFPNGFTIPLTNDKNRVWLEIMQARTLGGTPMHEGLRDGLTHNPTRGMLISDGDADSPESAIEMARSQWKPKELAVDTVHIGNSTRGETTLRTIAEVTGGIYLKFTNVQGFANAFHYLLPESREAIAGMLPEARALLLGSDK